VEKRGIQNEHDSHAGAVTRVTRPERPQDTPSRMSLATRRSTAALSLSGCSASSLCCGPQYGIRSSISETRNCVSSSVTFSAMTFHQRTDETFSENRQASRQSARPVSAPRTRIIRPSRLRGGTPAVRPPLLRSPASKPHGSLMRQLRRAVGADPSLKRQAKPDRRSASRRARAIPFVPKRGHDKIGATAYASLDKKGTEQKIHISRKARIVPGICFRTALWMIAGTPWPNFPRMATMRRSLSSWESRRGLPTPVKR
jgi:hypothetical protein